MFKMLIVLQLLASGADGYYTHRNSTQVEFREQDPIARPFVYHTPGQVGYFGSEAAFKILVANKLKTKHRKLAVAWAVLGIADNALCAAYSAENYKNGDKSNQRERGLGRMPFLDVHGQR